MLTQGDAHGDAIVMLMTFGDIMTTSVGIINDFW